jgi:importin-5
LLGLAEAYAEAMEELKNNHSAKMATKDEDEDVQEDVCAEDIDAEIESSADGLTTAIGQLAKVTQPFFKQLFDPLLQKLVGTFKQDQEGEIHVRLALCLLDEVIESMEGHCAPYLPVFVPVLLQFCQNPSPALRQAAIYGLGVAALSGAAEFKPFAPHVLTAAQALASQPNSRDDENCYCTDNAVAAVIKCVARHSDVVDIQGSLNLAINYLPFTHDIDEMETAFEYIVDLMNSNLDFVLGPNHVNLTKLIQGMAIVLWHTTYNTDSAGRVKIIAVCKNMAARADLLGKMQAVLAREDLVDQDAREAFTKALSS